MSWTTGLIRDYATILTPPSLWTLRQTLIKERAGQLRYGDRQTLHLLKPYTRCTARLLTNDLFTFQEMFVDEVYAPVKVLRDVRTIVDLGANAGYASMYFLRQFPHASVFAVEPNPDNLALCRANLSGLPARVLEAAVWKTNEPITFTPDSWDWNTACGTINTAPTPKTVTVPGLTIQSLLAESGFDDIDVLKIDIEGIERHIFTEAKWLQRVRCLLIEFHEDTRAETGFDRLLAAWGFTVSEHAHGHTVMARRPI